MEKGDDFRAVVARMERRHPELARARREGTTEEVKITEKMRREAARQDAAHRRRLGDDY